MQSSAKTVAEYLASLPDDRRAALSALREVILANLDPDYEEGMSYGMIGYHVPHRVFPAGYHCDPRQPLPFAGLASQKQHMSLYLVGVYIGGSTGTGTGAESAEGAWFREAWLKSGKKLDMGKACVRFKKLEDVPLEVVGEAIRRIPAGSLVERYLAERERAGAGNPGSSRASKPGRAKATGKKATAKKASPPATRPARRSAAAGRSGAKPKKL